jgi:hypothetical protein
MNDLIQSLPSPSPIAEITHTWMGESWTVDGETSVMMVMKISSESPSQQGARMEFLVPNRGFWWWRRSGSLSGKNAEPPLFQVRGYMWVEEGVEATAEAVTQQVGAARPGPRPLVVWWPPGPSPSRLLAPWVFW